MLIAIDEDLINQPGNLRSKRMIQRNIRKQQTRVHRDGVLVTDVSGVIDSAERYRGFFQTNGDRVLIGDPFTVTEVVFDSGNTGGEIGRASCRERGVVW